ncbi:hypothetical protein ALC56_09381 [Trachymyrmex septentrionalis]|uniref:Uncharacterized protein n=1 Tax=Trachymyrmex septentrionalis TaxID=34720 RepID=A0A195F7R2_9HYME|nr:hypothetical protein ALC56_09381 [Trachymyrmex septentrionalis]
MYANPHTRRRTNLFFRIGAGKKTRDEEHRKQENCVTLKLSNDTLTQWRTATEPFRTPTPLHRRCAYDVATGSMTAVYERCGENIRSSQWSSATVNFRPPLFRAGKAEKAAGGSRPVQGMHSTSRHSRRARLTTRLFHSFAGRPAAEMMPACFASSTTIFGFGGIYDVACPTGNPSGE